MEFVTITFKYKLNIRIKIIIVLFCHSYVILKYKTTLKISFYTTINELQNILGHSRTIFCIKFNSVHT